MIDSHKQERPIAVDLFAGAGGMTLGFEQAGFDVVASVEIDPIHCATHEFNFPFWTIFCQSIVDTTGKEIRSRSAIGNREIDVVFGGPPCQGFSVIGKRFFDDPRNSLVLEYIRLVVELQPKFFVMENVKGMTIGKHKEFLTEIINQFEAKGYKVCKDYKVLNASEYGIPQNRERLFLLGCRDDLELPEYPAPITKPAKSTLRLPSASPVGEAAPTLGTGRSGLKPRCAEASKKYSFADDLLPTPTVWDALKDLPTIEQYVELYKQDWVIADFGKPSDYGRQLRGFSSIDNSYLYERIYDPRLLTSSRRTEHTLESITRFFSTPHGKTEPISRLYKLDPQGICNTLRAGTPSNKGAFTSPRPIHPFIPRCITVREAARLHSYPDWFRFHATKWHGFRQIGNSVPPLLAKAIASEIIKSLKINLTKPLIIKDLGNEKLLTFDMSEAAKYYGVNPQVIEPRLRKSKQKESEI